MHSGKKPCMIQGKSRWGQNSPRREKGQPMLTGAAQERNSIMDEQEKKSYEQGNPFMDYNHIKVVSASADRAEMAVTLVPESRNLYGFMHGGLIYTILECTAGLAARQDGRRYVTQSSHINFLSNQKEGTVRAVAECVRRGRQMAVYRVQVLGENNKLMADGTVDMFCTGEAH